MSKNLKAFLLYVLLAVIFTWPLLIHMTNQYPSTLTGEGGDPNMYVWFMNTVAHGITDFHFDASHMIFFPDGMNFFAGYEAPIMLVVSTPIILLTHNPILAYNLILMLCFVLTAYTCYSLIHYLTKSYSAALIAGFSFGFSEYMIVRGVQHIDLLLLFTVPLVVLCAFKFLDNPSRKNILWLSLSVFLTALSAWYYLVGCLIFMGLLFLFNIPKFLIAKKPYFILAASITLAVLIPAIPMFLNRSDASLKYADQLVETRGTDPLNFFVPHPYIQDWTMRFYRGFVSPYESTSYFGLVGLIAIFSLIFLSKKIRIPHRNLWITTIIVFVLIALGTHLDLNHHSYSIKLPFSFLKNFIPFSRLRAPNRFFVFAYLSVTVVFGYFLSQAKNFIPNANLRKGLGALLLLLLFCESFLFPYPLMSIPVSKFYTDLGSSPDQFAIADIPFINPGLSLYNYYQIYHKKPIVDGEYFWTAYNPHTFDFIKSNALLLNSVPCLPAPIEVDQAAALEQLSQANVRYVVVHNFVLRDLDCPSLYTFIHKFFQGQKAVFADGEITVYVTKSPAGVDKRGE